jgi:hypothetical protein
MKGKKLEWAFQSWKAEPSNSRLSVWKSGSWWLASNRPASHHFDDTPDSRFYSSCFSIPDTPPRSILSPQPHLKLFITQNLTPGVTFYYIFIPHPSPFLPGCALEDFTHRQAPLEQTASFDVPPIYPSLFIVPNTTFLLSF